MTVKTQSALRLERDRLGLPRERVASRLDPPISSKTLERWENPGYPVPLWRLQQLAAIYGVEVAAIRVKAVT